MSKEDLVLVEGTIMEICADGKCKVKLTNGDDSLITAYLAGKFKKYKIRVSEGNKVMIEFNIHDQGRTGRIVEKIREQQSNVRQGFNKSKRAHSQQTYHKKKPM